DRIIPISRDHLRKCRPAWSDRTFPSHTRKSSRSRTRTFWARRKDRTSWADVSPSGCAASAVIAAWAWPAKSFGQTRGPLGEGTGDGAWSGSGGFLLRLSIRRIRILAQKFFQAENEASGLKYRSGGSSPCSARCNCTLRDLKTLSLDSRWASMTVRLFRLQTV